jgi:hypothetical protein
MKWKSFSLIGYEARIVLLSVPLTETGILTVTFIRETFNGGFYERV